MRDLDGTETILVVEDEEAIRVLYMSGYAQSVLGSRGTLEAQTMLVEKPFTETQLLTAVRAALDTPGAANQT